MKNILLFLRMKWLFFVLLAPTIFFGAPPIIWVESARLSGQLPGRAVWESRGGNHGPWWGTPQGDFITLACVALPVLAVLTLGLGAILSTNAKTEKISPWLIGLASFQIVWTYFLAVFAFWVTD